MTFVFLIIALLKKIKNININIKYRNSAIITVIAFLVISLFETTTRFSIGYADTISMIFFISVPLLYASNQKEIIKDSEIIKCEENL